MSTIHTRIKEKREKAGLSMEQLASAVGYKAWQTVQQWENGETAPNRKKLALVAQVLKTTVSYLQTGDTSRPTDEPIDLFRAKQKEHSRKLVQKLCYLAEQIDNPGLEGLIEVAQCFTKTHPLYQKNPAAQRKSRVILFPGMGQPVTPSALFDGN